MSRKKKLKIEIINIFNKKRRFAPPNKINTFAKNLKLGGGKRIRTEELYEEPGIKLKLKFRIGSVLTNKDLTR
ncbi:hypothetical protein NUSPORA_01414 [Nucleospora cyclopteri]